MENNNTTKSKNELITELKTTLALIGESFLTLSKTITDLSEIDQSSTEQTSQPIAQNEIDDESFDEKIAGDETDCCEDDNEITLDENIVIAGETIETSDTNIIPKAKKEVILPPCPKPMNPANTPSKSYSEIINSFNLNNMPKIY